MIQSIVITKARKSKDNKGNTLGSSEVGGLQHCLTGGESALCSVPTFNRSNKVPSHEAEQSTLSDSQLKCCPHLKTPYPECLTKQLNFFWPQQVDTCNQSSTHSQLIINQSSGHSLTVTQKKGTVLTGVVARHHRMWRICMLT